MTGPQIDDLDQLQAAADEILRDIGPSCAACTDPCCRGYMWVVPQEEDRLLDRGLQLVQINGTDGPTYLDSFPRTADGQVRLGVLGPPCPYRAADGRCTVHDSRPLTCHMYPLALEVHGPDVVWAVHRDCEHVRRAERADRYEDLLAEFRALVARVGPALRAELAGTMRRVEGVSTIPDMDCYVVLAPV